MIEFETILSICSIIIALSALFVSVWQSVMGRKFQRKSVTPHISIDFHIRSDMDPGIYIRSNGIGPAIIKNLEWIVENKRYSLGRADDISRAVTMLGLSEISVLYHLLDLGAIIEPGFSAYLVKFPDEQDCDAVLESIAKSNVYVEYESMYGEKYMSTFGGYS